MGTIKNRNCMNLTEVEENMNFQKFYLNLEKVEELENKLPTSIGSSKKQ